MLATSSLCLHFHNKFHGRSQMRSFVLLLLLNNVLVQTGGTKDSSSCLWRKFRLLHLSRCSNELTATHKHHRADAEQCLQFLKKFVVYWNQHEPESGYGGLFFFLSFLGWQGGRHLFLFIPLSLIFVFSSKQNKIFMLTLANRWIFPLLYK